MRRQSVVYSSTSTFLLFIDLSIYFFISLFVCLSIYPFIALCPHLLMRLKEKSVRYILLSLNFKINPPGQFDQAFKQKKRGENCKRNEKKIVDSLLKSYHSFRPIQGKDIFLVGPVVSQDIAFEISHNDISTKSKNQHFFPPPKRKTKHQLWRLFDKL